jgi:hypothetical protein
MDVSIRAPKPSAPKIDLESGVIRLAALLTAIEWANDYEMVGRGPEQEGVRDALIHVACDLAKELSRRI